MLEAVYEYILSDKFYLPIIYVFLGMLIYQVIAALMTNVNKFNDNFKNNSTILNHTGEGYKKRKNTVVSLVKNLIKYIIAIIIIIITLNLYGVDTTNILASLGIISVIVGLAFQDIIKDLLSGIFIVFDNAYAVGDWIEIDGFKGEVVSFGLKTTKIKSYTGEILILSNSSFNKVINYNLSKSKVLLKIPVSYNTKIDKLEEVLNNMKESILKIKNATNMKLLGLDSFEDSSMLYAIEIECKPNTFIGVKREVLKIIKMEFDKNKIEIPYNQLDIHIEK